LVLFIIGIEDNVQYELEIVPHIINAMKLFPCWSGIMRPLFGYGSETASSSRIESNFNNLKHRVFHNDVLPLRVDTFLEKIIQYYRGDHLLLQGSTQNIDEREKYDDIINEDNENDIELGEYGNHEVEEDHEDSADDEIRIDHGDDIGQLVNCERDSNLIAQRPSNSCLACSNGDFPTGLHKCKICQTNVHLFGCSVPATGTEEGCGEERLCLICADIAVENNATEKWGKKHITKKSKISRSASSYLSKQPGFDELNLNEKGSSASVYFLKNGNLFKNRTIKIKETSGVNNKFVLSNTCAIDSLMTVLACSASDSKDFKTFLFRNVNKNKLIEFILDMLNPTGKKMYNKRVELIYPHFKSTLLVGGIQLIDVTDTASSITNKLFKELPSITRHINCTNELCEKYIKKTVLSSTVISINVYDEKIDVQNEIENIINSDEICESCETKKKFNYNTRRIFNY